MDGDVRTALLEALEEIRDTLQTHHNHLKSVNKTISTLLDNQAKIARAMADHEARLKKLAFKVQLLTGRN